MMGFFFMAYLYSPIFDRVVESIEYPINYRKSPGFWLVTAQGCKQNADTWVTDWVTVAIAIT